MEKVLRTSLTNKQVEAIPFEQAVDEIGYYVLRQMYKEEPELFDSPEDVEIPDIGTWCDTQTAIYDGEEIETDTHSYILVK